MITQKSAKFHNWNIYGFWLSIVVLKKPRAIIFKKASIMKTKVHALSRLLTYLIVVPYASLVGDYMRSRITFIKMTLDIM